MAETLLEQHVAFQGRLRAIVPPGGELTGDAEHRAMLEAFRQRGGMMTTEEVSDALRRTCSQPLSRLARWIVSRDIVTVPWRGRTLVPLFQFTTADWAVRAGVARALAELRDIYDDREVALWFTTPNVWLGSRTPLACVDEDDHELWQAARADRFVARG